MPAKGMPATKGMGKGMKGEHMMPDGEMMPGKMHGKMHPKGKK